MGVGSSGLGQEEEEEGDYHTRDCKKICESLEDPFLKSSHWQRYVGVLCSCCAVGAHTRGLVNTNNSVGWHSGSRMTSAMPVYTHRSNFVPPSFVFFAFPLGKFEQVQLNEWCKKKATGCDDPKGRCYCQRNS